MKSQSYYVFSMVDSVESVLRILVGPPFPPYYDIINSPNPGVIHSFLIWFLEILLQTHNYLVSAQSARRSIAQLAQPRVVLFASVLFTYRANEGTLVRCMTCI